MPVAAPVVSPARFSQAPAGWHVSTSAPIVLVRGRAQGSTLATTWVANLSAPGGWSAQLHPGRAAIDVMLIRRDPRFGPSCSGVRLALPLRLADAQHATQEGSPLREDRFGGRLHGYDVDLRIDYGVASPSRAIRTRVQRMLARLRFPVWPGRCPTP